MATKTDSYANLVINRLKRSVYDELSSGGLLHKNELYLIDDDVYDVFNKRIVNVLEPQEETDAVNLNYLSQNYLQEGQMLDIIDSIGSSKLYNALSTSYPLGSQYVNGYGEIYIKDTTKWDIKILKGSISPSDVTISWPSGGTFGWRIHYNGNEIITYETDQLADVIRGEDDNVSIEARPWTKQDRFIKLSEVKTALASVTTSSTTSEIAQALINLRDLTV